MNPIRFLIIVNVFALTVTQALAQPDSLWSRTYGGEGNDSLWGIVPTADGGLALSGYISTGDHREADLIHYKLDRNYNEVWAHQVDFGGWESGHGLAQTPDGGFVVTGYATSSPQNQRRSGIILKTDGEGREEWTQLTDNTEYSETYSAVAFPNGDIAVGGTWFPGGEAHDDFAIWSIDARAQPQWMQHYGTPEASEYGLSLIRRSDGGLALAGQTMTFGEHGVDAGSMMLVLTDRYGAQQQVRTYSIERNISWAMEVIETRDGGFALAGAFGYSRPDSGVTDWNAWLVKTDAEGSQEWAREYDLGRDEWAMGVIQTADGGYAIVGAVGDNEEWAMQNSDCFLIRTDDRGETLWSTTFGGDGHDFGACVLLQPDGSYLIGGTTSSIGAGGTDFWLMKTGRDPLAVEGSASLLQPSSTILHPCFPNPFNSSTTIAYDVGSPGFVRIEILDPAGRMVGTVSEGFVQQGSYREVWNGGGLGSGSYLIRLSEAGGRQATIPLQVIK